MDYDGVKGAERLGEICSEYLEAWGYYSSTPHVVVNVIRSLPWLWI